MADEEANGRQPDVDENGRGAEDTQEQQPEAVAPTDAAPEDHRGEELFRARLRSRQMDGADFSGASMPRAELNKVTLQRARFVETDLSGVQMTHVDLTDAVLTGADLRGATLNNVNLNGADLTGADLTGASLKGVKLSKATCKDACLVGATLETVEFEEAILDEAELDGAEVEGTTFKRVTFKEVSFQGFRAAQCVLEGCTLDGCDLSGATLDTLLVKEGVLRGCDLGGTLFSGAKFRGVDLQENDLEGCVFHQCQGLRLFEPEIVRAGGEISLSSTARVMRVLRENRKAQIITAASVFALVTAVLVFLLVPSLWPSWYLLSRIEGVQQGPDQQQWCPRYTKLGELLAARDVGDVPRQNVALGTVAHCYSSGRSYEDAERIYKLRVDLASGMPDEKMIAMLELGRFYGQIEQLDDALDITGRVFDDPRSTVPHKLDALRLREDIFRQREQAKPDNEDWKELQVQIGETILAAQDENSTLLMSTPEELYVLGERDLADRLLTMTRPPLDHETAWALVDKALVRLRARDLDDEALDLMDHLADTERFTHDYPRSLLVYREALTWMDLDRAEDARASLEALAEEEAVPMVAARTLIEARLEMADGRADKVIELFDNAGIEEAPTLLAEEAVWVKVDAYMALDREPEAVDTLFPLLQAVDDHDAAQRLMTRVESIAMALDDTDLMTAMLQRVDNPLFAETSSQQDVILATLGRKSRAGELSPDDPVVEELVRSSDGWIAVYTLQLVMESARISGDEEAAMAAVWKYARATKGAVRSDLGMMIIGEEVNAGRIQAALDAVDELQLWEHVQEHQRGRLYELLVRCSLVKGNLDEALSWLEKARLTEPPIEEGAETGIAMVIIAALQEAERWEEALSLAADGLSTAKVVDVRKQFRREVLLCQYELGRDAAADEEIGKQRAETSDCDGELMRMETLERAARGSTDYAVLTRACTQTDVSATTRLAAAGYLIERGDGDSCQAVLDTLDAAALPGESSLTYTLIGSRAAAAAGNPDQAITRLEAAYAELTEMELRQQLTQALLDIHAVAEDGEGIVAVYSRFAEDFPDKDHQYLWENAARTLLRLREDGLVAQLGGEPEWEQRIRDARAEVRIREHIEKGEYEEGWTAITELFAETTAIEDRNSLLWMAQELGNVSRDSEAYLAALESFEAQEDLGEELAFSVAQCKGEVLSNLTRYAEAAEALEPLVFSSAPLDQRVGVMSTYTRVLGQGGEGAEFEATLTALAGAGYTREQLISARLSLVDGLVARQDHAAAQVLLKPLEGTPLSEETVRQQYHIIMRAWIEVGMYDEAMAIPTKFPPAGGVTACELDALLLQAIPWGTDQSATLQDRMVANCPPAQLSLEAVQCLVGAMSATDPQAALTLLEKHQQQVSLPDKQADTLEILRARLLSQVDRKDESGKVLRGIVADSSDAWVVAEATNVLLGEVLASDESVSAGAAEKDAREALTKVDASGGEARQIYRALVNFHSARSRLSDAIRWQKKLLEMTPEMNEERGYELLNLANFELQKNGHRSSSWRGRVNEALKTTREGSTLHTDLKRMQLAGEVAGASTSRAESLLDKGLADVPDAEKERFAYGLCDDVEWRMGEQAKSATLREIVQKRWPPAADGSQP